MLFALPLALVHPHVQDPTHFVTLPVVADQSIALHEDELDLDLGARREIRIKGNQHLAALRFDVSLLTGHRVVSATLVAPRGDHELGEVTISTIQVPWDDRGSTARAPSGGAGGWGFPGAPFPAVCGGLGRSLQCTARSTPRGGNYAWDLDPDLVQALAIGRAHGLAIHEHGSDLSRNPTILARESGRPAARLLVEVGAPDGPADPPTALRVVPFPREELVLLEIAAPSRGFAYDVRLDGDRLGDHLVPFVRPGTRQWATLGSFADLAGAEHEVRVRTLSRTGAPSAPVVLRFALEPAVTVPPGRLGAPGPALGTEDPWIVATLDRLAADGTALEGDGPPRAHPGFDGERLRLRAARGEVLGFCVRTTRAPRRIACVLGGLRVDVSRALHVDTPHGRVPDPLIPIDEPAPDPTRTQPAWFAFDVYVPFDEPRTRVTGHLVLDEFELPVELAVRPFALPREVRFVCEMNTYGLPDHVATFDALQRLAYDHRTHVNVLPYPHRTARPGLRQVNLTMRLRDGRRMDEARFCAIEPGATTTDWSDFVEAFGTYLDGTRFADGHRGAIPPPGFYLPFHESWPLHVRAHATDDPDAFRAFAASPAYARTFVDLVVDFQRLARARGWDRTGFQIYCNAKGSPEDLDRAPWTLDEPVTFWDYRALAYYGGLVRDALAREGGTRLRFRVDVSRPQFDRGQLAGDVAPLWIVALGAARDHRWLLRERRALQGIETWTYGTSADVHESSRRMQAFVLQSWWLGARGVVPWQTVDRSGRALATGDRLALFVFATDPAGGPQRVRATLRLAAYRRAQQDVEYLEELAAREGIASARALLRAFWSEEDLDRVRRGDLAPDPRRFDALREAVAARLTGR